MFEGTDLTLNTESVTFDQPKMLHLATILCWYLSLNRGLDRRVKD
jgi:hypothetical protein